MIAEPEDIVRFWFEDLSPKEWYGAPASVDAELTARFGETYEALKDGVPPGWLDDPQGVLAAILVLDQFPRNMFRGAPKPSPRTRKRSRCRSARSPMAWT